MQPFTRHPRSIGETYAEHAAIASGFGVRLLLAGLACLVHAVFPFLFVKTGSSAVGELHERMLARRSFKGRPPPLFERAELADTTTAPRKHPDCSAGVVSHSHRDVPALAPESRDGVASL